MIYKRALHIGVLLLAIVFLSGCEEWNKVRGKNDASNPKDDPNNPYAILGGEWHGREFTTPIGGGATVINDISYFIDGTGKITKINHNGTLTGITGTVTNTGTNTFNFILSSNTQGNFILDPVDKHLAFIYTDVDYSILQKGTL